MIGNIFAGVAANKVSQATEPIDHQREHTESLASIHQILCEIKDALDVITSGGNEADHLEIVNLQPGADYLINDHGLRHTALFAGATGATITLNIPGLAAVAYQPALGWNKLDFPSGTTITAAAATNLIFKASNYEV